MPINHHVFFEGKSYPLPEVKGRYLFDVPLAPLNWFRVGGPALVMFLPADWEDLSWFLKHRPQSIPYRVLGVGSNIILRDAGFDGMIIRLGSGFHHWSPAKSNKILCGAGLLSRVVAQRSADLGLGGLEFLSGIPGTIGGALRMNAGCYGQEVQDVLVEAHVMDPKGILYVLSTKELLYSYRHCALDQDWIFLAGLFQSIPKDPETIGKDIAQLMTQRSLSQPIQERTGGSTFKNPPPPYKKAWEYIHEAGLRGWVHGDACVSQQHCNFLIHKLKTGKSPHPAKDLEDLGHFIQETVFKKFGVNLEWEIERIGKKN
jgi:UDP-N-acetylmuramate dehydrogenase